jgi:hypothetical protein
LIEYSQQIAMYDQHQLPLITQPPVHDLLSLLVEDLEHDLACRVTSDMTGSTSKLKYKKRKCMKSTLPTDVSARAPTDKSMQTCLSPKSETISISNRGLPFMNIQTLPDCTKSISPSTPTAVVQVMTETQPWSCNHSSYIREHSLPKRKRCVDALRKASTTRRYNAIGTDLMDACTTIYHDALREERNFQAMSRQGPAYWQENKPVFIYLIKGRLSPSHKNSVTMPFILHDDSRQDLNYNSLNNTRSSRTHRDINLNSPSSHIVSTRNVITDASTSGQCAISTSRHMLTPVNRDTHLRDKILATTAVLDTRRVYPREHCDALFAVDSAEESTCMLAVDENTTPAQTRDTSAYSDNANDGDTVADDQFHEVSHIGISSEPLQELNQHNAFYRGGTKPTRRAAPSWQLVAFAGPVAPSTTNFWRNAWRMRRGVTHRMHFVCQLCILTGMILFGPRPLELRQTLQSVYSASRTRLGTDSPQNIAQWLRVANTLCVPDHKRIHRKIIIQKSCMTSGKSTQD